MIGNNTEALTLALGLAITAPTDALADECIKMANGIASTMTEEQIDHCKAMAVENVRN